MKQLLHNNILKKGILGIFLLFVLLLPVSLSFNVSTLDAGINLSVVNHVAHAAGDGLSLFSWGAGALDDLMNKIGYIMLTFASLFTWAGGITLDFTIEKLVLGMGKMLGGSLGRSVDDIWALVRDISNLAFIFGFIYIGISTILDPEKSSTKKVLAQIIIGALLINFSLFFVKFITDFANLTTVKIYNTMTNGGTGGISITLAEKLGILSIYTEAKPEALAAVAGSSGLPYYIMASIFMVTAGFVFAAGAALLISRFVTLIFIMIASPILFAATAFPQTEHHASALWKKLFDTAFFAPAYLILIFISIKFLDGLKIVTGKTSFTDALMDPMGDSAAVILQFVVMIFFMVQALLIANKFSLTGSEMVVSKTKSIIGGSLGAPMKFGKYVGGNVASYAGRNTVGKFSEWGLHAYEHHDAKFKDDQSWKGKLSRLSRGALSAVGVDDRAIRGTLHAGEHAKFGGSYSFEDDEKYKKERAARQAKINTAHDIEHDIEHGVSAAASDDDRIKMERAISQASSEQVQSLLKKLEGNVKNSKNPVDEAKAQKEYEALVKNMTSSQFDNLMKLESDKLDDTKKSKLRTARATAIKTKHGINPVVGAAVTSNPGNIRKASASDLEAMEFATLEEHAAHLTSKQIEEAKNLTTTERSNLKTSRTNQLTAILNRTGVSTPASARALLAHVGSDTEISKLPASILTDKHVARELTQNTLSKIIDNDDITKPERDAIKSEITTFSSTSPAATFFSTNRGRLF